MAFCILTFDWLAYGCELVIVLWLSCLQLTAALPALLRVAPASRLSAPPELRSTRAPLNTTQCDPCTRTSAVSAHAQPQPINSELLPRSNNDGLLTFTRHPRNHTGRGLITAVVRVGLGRGRLAFRPAVGLHANCRPTCPVQDYIHANCRLCHACHSRNRKHPTTSRTSVIKMKQIIAGCVYSQPTCRVQVP